MPSIFANDLALYGPDGRSAGEDISFAAASAYCRRLAQTHYENFTVASWLLPRRLRRHFYHVYAYCRWADDLADETGDPQLSLALLDWWEKQLRLAYLGRAEHPVLIALTRTIHEFDIPPEPLVDLLAAFRQDQHRTRYESIDELLAYCRSSANPVGRLVLYLGRCHDESRGKLSDSICTGLQLANFWQDVARDWARGRIYLPDEVRREHGCDESAFERREATAGFRRALAAEVARAEEYLRAGLPLVAMVSAELRLDVELFVRGGLETLAAIRRIDYDVWAVRPQVTKGTKLWLLLDCWWQSRRPSARGAGR